MREGALEGAARVADVGDRLSKLARLLAGLGRGDELAHLLGDVAHVFEDLGDRGATIAGDGGDVAERLVDVDAILADGLVHRLRGVGQVLEDVPHVLAALLRADGVGELLGDGLHAVRDLLHLVEHVRGLGELDDVGDLVAVPELPVVGGAVRDDEDALAEDEGALLAGGRVVEELDLVVDLDVEPRLAPLEHDGVDLSDGNPGDGHARVGREAGGVLQVGVDGVRTPASAALVDRAEHEVEGHRADDEKNADLGSLRDLQHEDVAATLERFGLAWNGGLPSGGLRPLCPGAWLRSGGSRPGLWPRSRFPR